MSGHNAVKWAVLVLQYKTGLPDCQEHAEGKKSDSGVSADQNLREIYLNTN